MDHRPFTQNLRDIQKAYPKKLKETLQLFRASQGVLILYMFLFYNLKEFIFIPLGRKIWGYVLSTTSSSFISNLNITEAIHYPQVILAALLLLVLFYLLTAWQVSGVLMCLEYTYQDKPVRLFRLIYLSALNVLHLLKPENWMFMIYLLVMMPISGICKAAGMLSEPVMPEYIQQWIDASAYTVLLQAALYLAITFFALRWFFVLQGVLLKHQSFKEAASQSRKMMQHKKLFCSLEILYFSIGRMIRICLLPGVVCALVLLISVISTGHIPSYTVAAQFAYFDLFKRMFRSVTSIYLEVAIMCFLMISYHTALKENGYRNRISLPDKGIRLHGKPIAVKGLYSKLCCGIVAISLLVYYAALYQFNAHPETVGMMMTPIQVIAHKGYSSVAPENTLDAFTAAIETDSIDMIELDVRMTKDNIPVVIHDASISAATGMPGEVYDYTYEELCTMTADYGMGKDKFSETRIPTFESVLSEYAGKTKFLVEIKADDRTKRLPQQILRLLRSYDCLKDSMIQSQSYDSLVTIKTYAPEVPCGLIIAIGSGAYHDLPCCDFFSVEHTFITETAVRDIHNSGKKIFAWTVNADDSITRSIFLDVDGIITDVPVEAYETVHQNDNIIDTFLDMMKPDIFVQEAKPDPDTQDF